MNTDAFTIETGWSDDLPLVLSATAWCSSATAITSMTVTQRMKADTTSADLSLPEPPTVPSVDASGAMGWTSPPGHVSVLRYLEAGRIPPPAGRIDVVTAANSSAFPDLSGLQPPFAFDPLVITTTVETFGPLPSVDAAASAGAFSGAPQHGRSDAFAP
jgi:hypothetical protein